MSAFAGWLLLGTAPAVAGNVPCDPALTQSMLSLTTRWVDYERSHVGGRCFRKIDDPDEAVAHLSGNVVVLVRSCGRTNRAAVVQLERVLFAAWARTYGHIAGSRWVMEHQVDPLVGPDSFGHYLDDCSVRSYGTRPVVLVQDVVPLGTLVPSFSPDGDWMDFAAGLRGFEPSSQIRVTKRLLRHPCSAWRHVRPRPGGVAPGPDRVASWLLATRSGRSEVTKSFERHLEARLTLSSDDRCLEPLDSVFIIDDAHGASSVLIPDVRDYGWNEMGWDPLEPIDEYN